VTRVPRALFPLNNPNADYTIEKHGDSFEILYDDHENHYPIRSKVFIGNSPVALDKFVGVNVRLDAHYRLNHDPYTYPSYDFSNLQCIAGKCHEIFAEVYGMTADTVVIDIDSIESTKQN
jgi:hypothetical protein